MSSHSRLLKVDLGPRSYPIRIGSGLLAEIGSYPELSGRTLRVLSDETVAPLYWPRLREALGLGDEVLRVIPAGEVQKSWDQAGALMDWLLSGRLARDACLVALGGGVIGDLAGFGASIYQRGIDFVQIPTTLLAQVDSSVGGKTGVNHPQGKNLIGAFHQPIAVIADTQTLKTLPPRELRAGLAEVVKYGLLADAELFAWIERNRERLLSLHEGTLAEAVERCCHIKARIVGQDEREAISGGPRALLNLGHTFGHAIEANTGYTELLHGEAVAIGLCLAADLSARHGWITEAEVSRVNGLITDLGLPCRPPAGMRPEDFRARMGLDKKVKAGRLRLVLLHRLGDAWLTADFDDARLGETLAAACQA